MKRRQFIQSGLTLTGTSLVSGCVGKGRDGAGTHEPPASGYLKRLDATPSEQQFALAYKWIKTEPRPFFGELRAYRPILRTPECTLVAKYEDVIEVLRLPSVFTVQLYQPMMGNYLMAQDDTPIHSREKSIMTAMLNRDDLPKIRQIVGSKAREVVDASHGQCEFISTLGRAMPTVVVQEYFGLDGVDPAKLIEWSYWNQYEAFNNQPFDHRTDAEEIHRRYKQSVTELQQYLGELVARRSDEIRRGTKRDDITTRLLRVSWPDSVGFSLERLALNVGGLLIGAVETTSQASVQALQQLIKRPTRLAEAKRYAEGDDNRHFDPYVWEALRFSPIGAYIFRKSVADYILAKGTARQTNIPAGTVVLALVQSAMSDESYFPNPDEFDPVRPQDGLLHFGFGMHQCMGKWVGMTIVPEIVRQVVLRADLKGLGDIDFKGTPFPQRYLISWNS